MLLVLSRRVIDLISFALSNRLKPAEDDTEQKVSHSSSHVCSFWILTMEAENLVALLSQTVQEVDRLKCATSVVHQADQTCRRLISEAMKTAKGQL